MMAHNVATIQNVCTELPFNDKDCELILDVLLKLAPDLELTGSLCWHTERPQDIDVFANTSAHFLLANVNPIYGGTSGGGSLGSVRFNNGRVNVICLTCEDYDVWFEATQIMCRFPYQPKARRHAIFEILRSLVKLSKTDDKIP